jgi:hypothetical protein
MSTPILGIWMRPSSMTGSRALLSLGGAIGLALTGALVVVGTASVSCGAVVASGAGVVVVVVVLVEVLVVVLVEVVVGGSVVVVVVGGEVVVVAGVVVVGVVLVAAASTLGSLSPLHAVVSVIPATPSASHAVAARRRGCMWSIMSGLHRPVQSIA